MEEIFEYLSHPFAMARDVGLQSCYANDCYYQANEDMCNAMLFRFATESFSFFPLPECRFLNSSGGSEGLLFALPPCTV